MYVRRRSAVMPLSSILVTMLATSCPSSLSGSAAESDAMHAIARLRAAARAEPSSLKSGARQASDSSSFMCVPKRLSSSARTYCATSCGSRSYSMPYAYSHPSPYSALTGQLGRRPWNE